MKFTNGSCTQVLFLLYAELQGYSLGHLVLLKVHNDPLLLKKFRKETVRKLICNTSRDRGKHSRTTREHDITDRYGRIKVYIEHRNRLDE